MVGNIVDVRRYISITYPCFPTSRLLGITWFKKWLGDFVSVCDLKHFHPLRLCLAEGMQEKYEPRETADSRNKPIPAFSRKMVRDR